MYSNPDSQPPALLLHRERKRETDINIDISAEAVRSVNQRDSGGVGMHGRPRQCMTPTPPLLCFRKKRERETGLLGDLAQCKHGTICCSEIWSGLAKSDRERPSQEEQWKQHYRGKRGWQRAAGGEEG